MDLTVDDLRSELEKRGLDSEGDQKELQARFEQELEKENNEEKTLETSTEDSTEKNPESEDTTEKEEMVAIKEGEGDVVGNGAEVDKKADESEVQSLQTPSVEEASTEKEVEEEEVKTEEKEKEEVNTEEKEKEDEVKNEKDEEDEVKNEKDEEEKEVKEESSTSPTENAKGNDDPAAADDSSDTAADTKDSTADPSGTNTKSEENESFIVLVDDTQNDLDADLLSKEKATNKKSDAASAGSTTCKSGDGKEENASGGDKGKTADAKKTEKKADEKKDGKSKSSTAVHRLKSSKNVSSGNPNSCNLWISGLSSNTKATNLKAVFTKYGKVVGAKIVTNARSPGARCYGFLTMSSSEEAAKCIQHLNQTELHGRMISVERAKTNPGLQPIKKVKPILKSSDKPEGKKSVQEEKSPNKKSTADKKTEEGNSSIKKSAEKKNVAGKSSDRKSDKTEPKKDGKGDSHSRQSPRSSSSKTKTPSKTSSRSPRRRHRSREGSSHISDRDYRMTSELRKRKSNLERIMQHQKRQIDHGRLVELELQRRQKKEAYMLERLREELRLEKEKLERKRMKLESAKQSQLWKERQEQEMLNGFERERQPVKRLYERKEAHSYSFWEAPKRPNLGSSSSRGGGSASGTSASRFNRTISDETTWFSNHKETYDRRNDSYYNRDNKAMKPVSRFSDSNIGRINHAPQRSSHERYAPPESSSRLADHVSSDDRFERRDIGSGGYHGHDTDHRNLTADRGREIDRRSVSAHERLGGRIRNQPAGGTNWKSDSWSHSHGGIDSNHWVNNNMNSNYSNNAGSSGGFAGGSGTSSSGHGAQNMGASSMYYNVGQQSGMMSAGGGGNNMGSRMQEPRFDAYKNLEHGSMRRY